VKSREGFTLIELMVVVLIVGILATVVLPMFPGRLDAAKWSEGKAVMGSIATAIRAYHAEHTANGAPPTTLGISNTGLGFGPTDLDGTYFTRAAFSVDWASLTMDPLRFKITCTAANSTRAARPTTPTRCTFDETGAFRAQ